jgi:hypothetical protein
MFYDVTVTSPCFLLPCDPEAQVGDRLELPNISNESQKLQSKEVLHTHIFFLKLSSLVTFHEGGLADTTISNQHKLKINNECNQQG